MPLYTTGSQSSLPQVVLEYLKNGACEGERNARLFAAACQCRDCALGQDVAEATLLDRAKADGLGPSEARKTIRSAYTQSARDPAHGSTTRAAPPPPLRSDGQWPGPVALPDPNGHLDLSALMTTMFAADEGIAIGVGSRSNGDLVIDGGIVKKWAQWQKCRPPLANWNKGFGLFYRVNPMCRGGKTDQDVTAYRYALIEFDFDADGNKIPKEVQYAFVLKFDLPVVALVDSGGKSLHAIIRIDAKIREEFDERLALVWSLFPNGSIDRNNKNPSRYTDCRDFRERTAPSQSCWPPSSALRDSQSGTTNIPRITD